MRAEASLPAVAAVAAVAAFQLLWSRRRRNLGPGLGPTHHHPSALRNRIPILKELLALLPTDGTDGASGLALEVGSGTGAHVEVYAPAFPGLTWRPSEFVPAVPAAAGEQWSKYGKIGLREGTDELANIDAHGCSVFKNVLPAVALDLRDAWDDWPEAVRGAAGQFVLVVCSNTLHITPFECSEGLFDNASRALACGGHLVVYGPFKVAGEFVGADGGAGNLAFDKKLRDTNSAWGIRDLDELGKLAGAAGLERIRLKDMPANNLLAVYRKQEPPQGRR